MVFIFVHRLWSWESKAGLDAAVRGRSDAKSAELFTGDAGERQEKGTWVCWCDGDTLVCPAAKIFYSWSRGFNAPWSVILSRAGGTLTQ